MTKQPPQLGEVYLEFHQVGNMVKVSAIDSKSLTEVSFMGPASTPREQLKTTAISKLRYVIAKKQNGG